MCQHFSGGAAESDHPWFPPEGCCEAPWVHAAGQQPGCQGDRHWSTQVSPQCGGVVWTAPTKPGLVVNQHTRVADRSFSTGQLSKGDRANES